MRDSQDMRFVRFGRTRQLKVESAADLKAVLNLDEAHWVATAAPIEMINCDSTFLKLLDTDNNGRILCFEVKDAISWLIDVFDNTDGITNGSEELSIDWLNAETPSGAEVKQACMNLLKELGADDSQQISLHQVRQVKLAIEKSPVSETGVVLPEATDDGQVRQFIADVISATGGADHPAGSKGIDKASMDKFLSEAKAYLDSQPGADGQADEPQSPVACLQIFRQASLGTSKLKEYLDERYRQAVEALIARAGQTAARLGNVRLVEKAILYQANLLNFVNNFVSFPHLYDPHKRAMFEMGTLIMDGRRFNFSVKVFDRSVHSNVAKSGNMFVLYVEVLPSDGQRYEIAVPVTSGGRGNLYVGKRGIFLDITGRESDARVVQIVENPISLSEALISPFRRLGRTLTGKIESLTATAEKKLDAAVSTVVEPTAGKANRSLLAGGLLMGGGVALAALGSAVAYIAKTLSGVPAWKILVGIAGAILAVALPASIIAVLKLRQRDLSTILEGSGWAINAKMRLTFSLGRFFTCKPPLPKSARSFIARKWKWLILSGILLAAAILLVWYFGYR